MHTGLWHYIYPMVKRWRVTMGLVWLEGSDNNYVLWVRDSQVLALKMSYLPSWKAVAHSLWVGTQVFKVKSVVPLMPMCHITQEQVCFEHPQQDLQY